jgi:hypothetical protein
VSALELAGTCLLETLGRSLMCLQLGHSGLSITTQNGLVGPEVPRSSDAMDFAQYAP